MIGIKDMYKFILFFIVGFFLSACDINDFIPKEPDSAEVRKKALELEYKQHIAALEAKKELANIDLQKQIELGKMDKDIRLKTLELENAQAMEKLKLQIQRDAAEREYAMKRNYLLLAAVLLVVIAIGIYFLWKRHHENKLQAYNDNLQKYFYQKENESRMRLAEKIIDSVAEGKASSEQEAKLLNILQGTNQSSVDGKIETDFIDNIKRN